MRALLTSAVLLGCTAIAAAAPNDTPEQLVSAGLTALERGAHDEAIDHFELLADRGFVHPDASYNRGVAYVRRAASSAARSGDLGRAAAALAEAQLLRPSDDAAEQALERVRQEIVWRRAREGAPALMARRTMARAIVELAAENTWALGAALSSLVLTLALAARRVTQKPALRLAATTTASISAVLLVLLGSLTAAAVHYRRSLQPAVIVAPEARLLDAAGVPQTRKGAGDIAAVPEGASVDVVERRPNLVRIEWGTAEGWITPGQLRMLAER